MIRRLDGVGAFRQSVIPVAAKLRSELGSSGPSGSLDSLLDPRILQDPRSEPVGMVPGPALSKISVGVIPLAAKLRSELGSSGPSGSLDSLLDPRILRDPRREPVGMVPGPARC